VIDTIGVIIPAHDEETLIGQCLDAMHHSRDRLREDIADPPSVQIVVVLDACTDDSAVVASAYRDISIIAVSHRSVGAARAAGARHLLRQPTIETSRMWLASPAEPPDCPARSPGGAAALVGAPPSGGGRRLVAPSGGYRRWSGRAQNRAMVVSHLLPGRDAAAGCRRDRL
jgi:hypothetical protein